MNIPKDKKTLSIILVHAILLVGYVAIFFLIPFPKKAPSWISLIFTMIAIVVCYFSCEYAFSSKKTLTSKVYGLPIFRVGILYLIIQFISGIIICAIASFVEMPYWISMVLYLLYFGAAIIGLIITDHTREHVEKEDKEIREVTKAITYFQVNIHSIIDSCVDIENKEELKKLSERFRYSDPVSSDATREIEMKITNMLEELKVLVEKEDKQAISECTKKLTNTLEERNRICKANK